MFIHIVYKDAAELSVNRHRTSEPDLSVEKTLLVNPECPVRIMLEYIRKMCRLGIFTQFDLCDENGALKGLFNMPTYEYATELFEHNKSYYIIVTRTENDRRISVLPQLNHENRIYQELKAKVKRFMISGNSDSRTQTSPIQTPAPSVKGIPAKVAPSTKSATPPPPSIGDTKSKSTKSGVKN